MSLAIRCRPSVTGQHKGMTCRTQRNFSNSFGVCDRTKAEAVSDYIRKISLADVILVFLQSEQSKFYTASLSKHSKSAPIFPTQQLAMILMQKGEQVICRREERMWRIILCVGNLFGRRIAMSASIRMQFKVWASSYWDWKRLYIRFTELRHEVSEVKRTKRKKNSWSRAFRAF